ncbi:MAG: hypothetical protein J3R72DRAFT_247354, partial [Linnemannia gamsii]
QQSATPQQNNLNSPYDYNRKSRADCHSISNTHTNWETMPKINWRLVMEVFRQFVFVNMGIFILYNDKQTPWTRPATTKDLIEGYPKRELIDTMAGYAYIIYAIPSLYRVYDPHFTYRHINLLWSLYALSTALSIIYYVAAHFDTSESFGIGAGLGWTYGCRRLLSFV